MLNAAAQVGAACRECPHRPAGPHMPRRGGCRQLHGGRELHRVTKTLLQECRRPARSWGRVGVCERVFAGQVAFGNYTTEFRSAEIAPLQAECAREVAIVRDMRAEPYPRQDWAACSSLSALYRTTWLVYILAGAWTRPSPPAQLSNPSCTCPVQYQQLCRRRPRWVGSLWDLSTAIWAKPSREVPAAAPPGARLGASKQCSSTALWPA